MYGISGRDDRPASHSTLRDVLYARPAPAEPLNDPEAVCPHCGCTSIHQVTVRMKTPRMRTGEGICRYLGCPACPWASPAVITGDPNGGN